MIVTVDELKAALRVDHGDDDSYLARLIAQAQAAAEDFCRVKFSDTDAPEPAKLAVVLMASFHYENPDMESTAGYRAMRRAFEALLYPHRDEALMF